MEIPTDSSDSDVTILEAGARDSDSSVGSVRFSVTRGGRRRACGGIDWRSFPQASSETRSQLRAFMGYQKTESPSSRCGGSGTRVNYRSEADGAWTRAQLQTWVANKYVNPATGRPIAFGSPTWRALCFAAQREHLVRSCFGLILERCDDDDEDDDEGDKNDEGDNSILYTNLLRQVQYSNTKRERLHALSGHTDEAPTASSDATARCTDRTRSSCVPSASNGAHDPGTM